MEPLKIAVVHRNANGGAKGFCASFQSADALQLEQVPGLLREPVLPLWLAWGR
jgi:hypothetical protein